MRPLPYVIDALLKIIPDDEANKDLRHDLKSCQSSSLYSAPEMQNDIWSRTANTLKVYLGAPDTDWKMRVALVFADKLSYEAILGKVEEKTPA